MGRKGNDLPALLKWLKNQKKKSEEILLKILLFEPRNQKQIKIKSKSNLKKYRSLNHLKFESDCRPYCSYRMRWQHFLAIILMGGHHWCTGHIIQQEHPVILGKLQFLGFQVLLLIPFRSMYLQNFSIFPLHVRYIELNRFSIFSCGSKCREISCLHLVLSCRLVLYARRRLFCWMKRNSDWVQW